ncbi:CbtA family protein [Nonomuraea africana]|uniref:Cobalt transporter CbtA n=1 Tax=Nonomuraea africana TaxID=46171 RepID=A0ABR9KVN7_9ACTN|nr:CbtA family protein [Nonomuraea africana]MBE1566065.1 putative cobalt transporter CbtA [Nonomuraea africana]
MRALLVRGMLAGLLAAAAGLIFAWLFGEPEVSLAIAVEHHHADAGEPEPVSRIVQQTLGLAVGLGMFGVALGGLFGVAFAIAYGRIGRFSARATAALVAGGGFVAVALVPFLKYPANPPAAGSPDTLGMRTGAYFALIAVSIVIVIFSVQVGRRLAARLGDWNATLVGGGVLIALVAVACLVLPEVDEVPAGFPAEVLWRFRIASFGIHAVLWTVLGLVFGALTERRTVSEPQAAKAPM